MNIDQDKAKSIFLEAIEKHNSEAWDSFLTKACGNNVALRRQVEILLDSHQRAESFLEKGAVEGGRTVELLFSDKPVTQVGPYKILQQIGEGGMGVVYMAEQTEPVRRKVALKVVKPGMDSNQIIARFEAERQALSMMDHVNIARVLDAGATQNGRPYFVMELVHGVTITKYCDENHLTPRQRLELFVPVCHAIQHAHQKGIIHRDIKPSNVMITLYDGKPVPKVIDFGVAKAIEQKLTDRTLFTQYGTVVGTLEYMSPEQAEISALGVDTRSDIYSLGVLLYELLTGSTPLSPEKIKEVAFADILRLIKDVEPPKPSTRLSESGEALASISANRQMEPNQLTKLVRGELDWIVMKTLEKERNRRYETAVGLAADVQRYLNDEAVEACPPSARYRLHKFLRRNKGPVTAGLGLAAILVLGIVGTSIGMAWALNAEHQATLSAKSEFEQRQRAELAYEAEVKQRRRARNAVDEMYTQVAQKWLANQPRMEKLQREFLEKSLQYYQEFAEEQSNDPVEQLETAKAYRRVGTMYQSLEENDKSKESHEKSIAITEKLSLDFPDAREYREELADNYIRLGYLQMYSSQPGVAKDSLEKALVIYEKLNNDFPGDNSIRKGLAASRHNIGNILLGPFGGGRQPEEAKKHYSQAVELYRVVTTEVPEDAENQSNLGATLNDWGLLLLMGGKLAEAFPLLDEAISRQKEALRLHPGKPSFRLFLCNHLVTMADIADGLGNGELAVTKNREALAEQAKLADDFRDILHYQHAHAEHAFHLGKKLKKDNPQEAEMIFRQAAEILVKLSDSFDKVIQRRELLVTCHLELGHLHFEAQRYEEATANYRTALNWKPTNAFSNYVLGRSLIKQQMYVEAEPLLQESLKLREQKDPDLWTTFQAMSLLGDCMLGQKKYAEAEPLLLTAYEGIFQRKDQINDSELVCVTDALDRIVLLYQALGQQDKAEQWRSKRAPQPVANSNQNPELRP